MPVAAVEAELRFDPMVDAAGITVNNIGGSADVYLRDIMGCTVSVR